MNIINNSIKEIEVSDKVSLYSLREEWKPLIAAKMRNLTAVNFPRVHFDDLNPMDVPFTAERPASLIIERISRDAMINQLMTDFIARFNGLVNKNDVFSFIELWKPEEVVEYG